MSDDNFGFPKPADPLNIEDKSYVIANRQDLENGRFVELPAEADSAGYLAYIPVSHEENDVAAVPVQVWLDSKGALTFVIIKSSQTEYLQGLLVSGQLSGVYFFEERTAKEDVGIQKELGHLLNRYSAESPSGTPDFILAEFLIETLKVFNETVSKRAQWRGELVGLFGDGRRVTLDGTEGGIGIYNPDTDI